MSTPEEESDYRVKITLCSQRNEYKFGNCLQWKHNSMVFFRKLHKCMHTIKIVKYKFSVGSS